MRGSLLTVSDVAERLGIRPDRVYTLIREQLLPCVKLGRQVRVDATQLEAWIASGGQALPGGWRRQA